MFFGGTICAYNQSIYIFDAKEKGCESYYGEMPTLSYDAITIHDDIIVTNFSTLLKFEFFHKNI
jgi:hypothetical protein